MFLFTENAIVNTYIGGELVFAMEGRAQIEDVFSTFLADFHSVYHLNGQHTVTFQDETHATAINYCQVALVKNENVKDIIVNHYIRYNDTYEKVDGTWLIAKRIANSSISDTRELGK